MLNVSVYAGSICVDVESIVGYGRIIGDEIYFLYI